MEKDFNNVDIHREEALLHGLQLKFEAKVTTPFFQAERGKDWVPFLTGDKKQQYPDYLLELFNNSAIHGAIVLSKIQQVKGNGFTWDASLVNSEFIAFMDSPNDYDSDMNDVLDKVTTDFEIFSGFALKVTWTNDWTKIAKVEHLDYSKVRAGKVNSDTGLVDAYYYSWDWTKQRADRMCLPAFNQTTSKRNKDAWKEAAELGSLGELQEIMGGEYSQIYYYKGYRPNNFYYPLPSYSGALMSIETDIACDIYGINSFKNGLNATAIVTMIGINSPEQQDIESRKFLNRHTNSLSGNGSGVIIAHAKTAEEAIKVETLANKAEDKIFTSVNANVLQKILSGHRVTDPLLVGIKTEGQLGAAAELKQSIEFWNNTVIHPDQLTIERVFNKIMKINEYPEVSIIPFTFAEFENDQEETKI